MPPPDADRNLLFAVLALQADCLTQPHFVEACTLWASRKDKSIAELMVERGCPKILRSIGSLTKPSNLLEM